jgi:hypothetical protein
VLKCFDFHALSPLQLLFLTASLKDFLLLGEVRTVTAACLRLHAGLEDRKASGERLAETKLLRDGLDFFLQHHLLPTASALVDKQQGATLKKRIQLARQALQGNVDDNWMFQ